MKPGKGLQAIAGHRYVKIKVNQNSLMNMLGQLLTRFTIHCTHRINKSSLMNYVSGMKAKPPHRPRPMNCILFTWLLDNEMNGKHYVYIHILEGSEGESLSCERRQDGMTAWNQISCDFEFQMLGASFSFLQSSISQSWPFIGTTQRVFKNTHSWVPCPYTGICVSSMGHCSTTRKSTNTEEAEGVGRKYSRKRFKSYGLLSPLLLMLLILVQLFNLKVASAFCPSIAPLLCTPSKGSVLSGWLWAPQQRVSPSISWMPRAVVLNLQLASASSQGL